MQEFFFLKQQTMYKLINTKTKEETLCEKVMIDGFYYYVSGKETKWAIDENNKLVNLWFYPEKLKGFVLATNNPNIDISKVVDEVEKWLIIGIAEEENEANSNKEYNSTSFFNGIKLGYNKSQETHPFSEQDMIEFYNFAYNYGTSGDFEKPTKELLQLWEEQQHKIVYYGE